MYVLICWSKTANEFILIISDCYFGMLNNFLMIWLEVLKENKKAQTLNRM